MRRLTVLTEVAHSNTIDGERIVLNRMQCHHLAHTCVSTLNKMSGSSLPDRLKKELHETILETMSYFKSCTEALWLSSLATHLDPHEAYLLHLKDLIVCVATSLALAQYHGNALPFVDCFIQSMKDCENTLSPSDLKDHLRADEQEMLGLLRSAQKSDNFLEKIMVDRAAKKGCLMFFLKRKKFNVLSPSPRPSSNSYRLAAFLAQKCDETVSLSASPKSVPKAFFIDPKDLSVLNRSLIGEEGLSKVYEQRWLDQTVAVKEFDTDNETFIKEVSILAGLSNPYVIKLIGWSRNRLQGTHSLIMERMDEGLHDYMSCNSMLLDVAVDIMLQISRGMEYLHAMNVIHRDLKPSNVLVRSRKCKEGYLRIKLADFGVAKYQPDTPFFSTERQGTLYYRAPEVLQYSESIEGEGVSVVFKKYTLKADVFSFGVLCYEILAEKAPECFICNPKEYYNRVANNVRPEMPELSKVLEYMKSAMIVFDSPTIAKEAAILSKFVEEVDEATG